MKYILKIFIIFAILIVIAGGVVIFYSTSPMEKLNLNNIVRSSDLKKDINILVSGNLMFSDTKVYDKEFNSYINYPMAKKVKNIAYPDGWKDDKPIYLSNKCYIRDVCISEELIKDIITEKLIEDYANESKIDNSKLIPMIYSNDKNIYLSTNEAFGIWRLRYYKREVDTSKTYTVIGKWDGEKVVQIDGLDKSLYEGEVTLEDLGIYPIKTYIGIACIALCVIFIIIIIIIIINKKR